MTRKERDQLLVEMTDEVAQKCLFNNYRQTQIIDSIGKHAPQNMYQHARFMRHLEEVGVLSRRLEHLPSDKAIKDRIAHNHGLTRPELSILLSYSKLTYKTALLESASLTEPCYDTLLLGYFPRLIRDRFSDEILHHPLRKEIIATILSNQIANNIGIGFGSRIREETGTKIEGIARAYVVCVEVFDLYDTWRKLERLDNAVNEQDRYEIFRSISGLLERSISWLLRNLPPDFNVSQAIERYRDEVENLRGAIGDAIIGQSRKNYLATKRRLIKARLPEDLAQEIVDKVTLASAFDIIETRSNLDTDTEAVAKLFYAVSERLQLAWIRDAISQTVVRTHWNHLAILNLRNDLHANQRNLTELILSAADNKRHTNKALSAWQSHYAEALERYDAIIKEFSAMRNCDFPTISVAVSEVRRLVQLAKRSPAGQL